MSLEPGTAGQAGAYGRSHFNKLNCTKIEDEKKGKNISFGVSIEPASAKPTQLYEKSYELWYGTKIRIVIDSTLSDNPNLCLGQKPEICS